MASTMALNPRIKDVAVQLITRGGGMKGREFDLNIVEAMNEICARRKEKAPTHAKNIPKEKRE